MNTPNHEHSPRSVGEFQTLPDIVSQAMSPEARESDYIGFEDLLIFSSEEESNSAMQALKDSMSATLAEFTRPKLPDIDIRITTFGLLPPDSKVIEAYGIAFYVKGMADQDDLRMCIGMLIAHASEVTITEGYLLPMPRLEDDEQPV